MPVRTKLRKRGLDVDPLCPWCGIEEESIPHVLLECFCIRRVWFAVLGVHVTGATSFHASVLQILEGVGAEMVARFFTTVYAIWEARNACVFEDRELSIGAIMDRVRALEAFPRPTVLPRSSIHTGVATWNRPAAGWIKVNFDASVRRSMAGFGMVARDEEGMILAAVTLASVMMQSAGLAEALCLRWVMSLALELGFFNVCFETDSLQLFQWWRIRSRGCSYLDLIISDCRSLVSSFTLMDLLFVRRSGNTAADFLARGASSFAVWIEEGPPGLDTFVASDALASMPA
ncbi:uncharacterized protein LOC130729288 [Lotus japonicus]|uniref:uncharacterized protein LOC130729288 n=1 Tax=Lotus japonicus TaxID=34305 RepID=UPI00258F40BA|nr:uncharacterized protein LOC130729288 [Lotus japonicus]